MRCTILRIRTESLPAPEIKSNCMGQTLWETEGLSYLVGKMRGTNGNRWIWQGKED